jgi:DNA-directed RNA polymerase subunit RPC12/RpoP
MNKNLKDLKDTYKRKDVLLPSVERHVLKQAQMPSDRRSDIMHPSEMAKSSWCGRHDYYRIVGEPINYKGRSASFRLENIFDYGHSVHAKYQRWLQEMGILWGKWSCKECKNEWLSDTPAECPNCHSKRIRYKEVPLVSEELMIAGHSDGIVLLNDVYKMIEIKTVGIGTLRFESYDLFDKYQKENLTLEELWWHIKRPFSTHIRQGQIYMHIAKQVYPELDINEIIFIYEWKPTQEVKEFVVTYNPELISNTLLVADLVASAVKSDTVLDRPDWAKQDGKTCSACEYRSTCWGASNDDQEGKKNDVVRVKRSTSANRSRAIRS